MCRQLKTASQIAPSTSSLYNTHSVSFCVTYSFFCWFPDIPGLLLIDRHNNKCQNSSAAVLHGTCLYTILGSAVINLNLNRTPEGVLGLCAVGLPLPCDGTATGRVTA